MALEEDKIEAVDKISKALDKNKSVAEDLERVPANREQFQGLVDSQQQNQNPQTDQAAKVEAPSKANGSLMDEVRKLHQQSNNMASLSPEELKNRANGIIAQLEEVKSRLSQAETINPSYNNVLHNRLSHINDTIKIALSKAGVETNAPFPGIAQSKNPIQSFLGYLTHAQDQFESLNSTIDRLGIGGREVTPGAMLTLQIKIGYAQQQIELFTSLLNKALESTKTIMNVQV